MTNSSTHVKSRHPLRGIALALTLVLLGGWGAHLVQTDLGEVKITGLTFFTDNGQWIAADLFRPKTATASNPAPLVVVCPGFERSKETMGSFSIELARRGIVVIVIDPYNQGASSSTQQRRSASKEGYGVVPVVEQVCASTQFDFVDKARIGAAGYSAGGNAVLQSASLFGARQARALRAAQRLDSEAGRTITAQETAKARAENKLSAIFVGGYVLTMSNSVLDTVDANVGMDYALWDEGAFRTRNGNADMRTAAESLCLVNSALPDAEKISTVEPGKKYGDPAKRTLRIVHNTSNIHPVLPYDREFVAHLTGFFNDAFQLPADLAPTNQTWGLKELFTLVALIGAMLFIVPFTALLLRLSFFQPLAKPVPPPQPRPQGRGRILFWFFFTLSATIACFLFIPLAEQTRIWFPAASAAQQTWWFPQRINNAILLWAVVNGLLGLLLFCLHHRLSGKKNGASPAIGGITTNAGNLARSLLLALSVLGGFYALVFASHWLFHTDMRFLFVAASVAFPSKMLLVALEYLPLFFIFYLANSIRVNTAGRFADQPEWANLLIHGLGNSLGLLLILLIQYSQLARHGTVFWTDGWLYVNLLLGVVPMMFVLPYFHRALFRLTGSVWPGSMITCLIFILMMLTNNVCYIPLK